MSQLKTPIIAVIIGEGASGGALGLAVADRVLMLENTWYSVISPESCSSILFRTWDKKEQAANMLKLTAQDMLRHELIDGIVPEPLAGIHHDPATGIEILKKQVLDLLKELRELPTDELLRKRHEHLLSRASISKK